MANEIRKKDVATPGFVSVGKMKDAHGIRGELFIVLFAGEAAWLKQLKKVRLVPDVGGEAREFTIRSVRLHKNGFIAKTEEIRDRNLAESLKGLIFEIPEELLVSKPGESIYLREIDGFHVVTQDKGEVGQIVGFSSNGAQDLLIVKTSQGEFEIPFVEGLVESVDYKAKKIHMDLPLGLLGEELGEEEPESDEEGEDDQDDVESDDDGASQAP